LNEGWAPWACAPGVRTEEEAAATGIGWRAPKGEEAEALAAEASLEGGMLAAMCGMRKEEEEEVGGREEEGEGGGMWWRGSSRKPWMGWWPRCGFLGGLR